MPNQALLPIGANPGPAASTPPITSDEMWENLCRADELLEACEALAATLDPRSHSSAPPRADERPTCDLAG
jgi:hypothetical protein